MAEEPIDSPLVEVAEDDEMLLRLRLHPAALRAMRRWLFDRLTSAGVEVDRAEEVMLAATEAASNAIEHAQAPSSSHVELHLTLDPVVHVQVRDTGAWKEPDPVTQRGRGTRIMSALAELTVDRTPEGTVVDLTFPFGAARPLAGFAVAKAWRNCPRPVHADDLLPERALAGDGLARATLISRIYRPLQAHSTELLTTLWSYLDNGRSLEATARELFVHPNTVRYRLKRVSDVIGWDATGAREALILQSALIIGSMSDHEHQPRRRPS